MCQTPLSPRDLGEDSDVGKYLGNNWIGPSTNSLFVPPPAATEPGTDDDDGDEDN